MVLGFTTTPLLACGWFRLALTWLLLSWMAVTSVESVKCNRAMCGHGAICGPVTCVCDSGYTGLHVKPNSYPPVLSCFREAERLTTGLAIGFGVISLVLILVVIGLVVSVQKLNKRLAVMAESSPPVTSTNYDHQGATNYESLHSAGRSRANYEDMSTVPISGQTRMTGSEPIDSRNYTNIISADSAYVNVSPD